MTDDTPDTREIDGLDMRVGPDGRGGNTATGSDSATGGTVGAGAGTDLNIGAGPWSAQKEQMEREKEGADKERS